MPPTEISSGSANNTSGPVPVSYPRSIGDYTWGDIKHAWQMIDVKRDLSNLPKIPCARTALLHGISAGIGAGALRYFSTGRLRTSYTWFTFAWTIVAITQWEICQAARRREQKTMWTIQQNFKHISALERKG